MRKPIIAITMGDPSGIGPELILKALANKELYEICYPFVVGDPYVLKETSTSVDTQIHIRSIEDVTEASFSFTGLDVLCPEDLHISKIEWGKLDRSMGKAAAVCLKKACELALEKRIDGMVMAPMNKEAFHLAGYNHLDELGYLRDLTSSPEPFVIGVVDRLWTIAVTQHIPFRAISDMIKRQRVLRAIQLMAAALEKVCVKDPKVAVAALNVHGGEGGLFGSEELDEIGPAIDDARKLKMNVQGPFPADTLFLTAIERGFDAVVCMYHDQANIARKLLARRKGVTLLMGLPVPCGTTAHGTAFDIAGKGIADPGSFHDALKYTALLSSS